jgi:hypothetical protein
MIIVGIGGNRTLPAVWTLNGQTAAFIDVIIVFRAIVEVVVPTSPIPMPQTGCVSFDYVLKRLNFCTAFVLGLATNRIKRASNLA